MTDTQIACLGALDFGAQMAAEFEIIWDIYPKRVSKPEAFAAYSATRKRGVRLRILLVAVRAYKEDRRDEDKKFTMHAGTFFGKQKRYEDYDGKTNGKTERKDGQWTPPMRDLQALAKRQEQEEATRQKTSEDPTKDPVQTERSVEDRMSDL